MFGLLFAAPAFVAPASAVVSRRAAVTMNEATRDAAPPVHKAPSSGYTLSLTGGVRTIADVRADQAKAAKGYTKGDGSSDLKRINKGWNTN
tara:strand:+ start:300 stop:572 length:273 start_codon:yes stop_codon:yes gene_type:complete